MIQTSDLVNCVKMLECLQSHSPLSVSREDLANMLSVDIRTITRYAKRLSLLGVTSKKGKSGGYTYEGKKLYNSTFDCVDDLYAINLTLNSNYVIRLFNKKKVGGINLMEDLIFHNDLISEKDLQKMIKITEAIKNCESISIRYIKDNKPFECYVQPICFKNYDGFVYLFAYYRNCLRVYSIEKLEFIDYISDNKFVRRKEDIDIIKRLPNHEIYGKDDVCSFTIIAQKEVYNRLKKSFKSSINIDYTKPYQEVTIVTRSYKEVVSILLSCANFIKFKDKDNPVYNLYKKTLEEMRCNVD